MTTDPVKTRPPRPPAADPQAETVLSMPPDAEATAPRSGVAMPEVALDDSAIAALTDGALAADEHDRLLIRLILDRGLATEDEIERASRARATTLFGGARPLAKRLLAQGAVTRTQLARLEEAIASQRTGRTIPGFKLIGRLGKGTSAVVFKARQASLDRLVALKILPARALRNPLAVEQFWAEGRIAARLNHPNIVQAFDVGQAGGFHYFVMEYVEGPTLYEVLQAQSNLDQERALDLTIAMAEALLHAHEKGLIHRDVKPKNIILATGNASPERWEAGTPKLADLGLARFVSDRATAIAERGRPLGTPYYIAPEQVRGDLDIGPPADIYGLGATFYHMVTGQPPFGGETADQVMQKHLHEKHIPAHERAPGLNPGVSEVIDHMMAKDPARRYTDCASLLTDLRAWRSVFVLQRGEDTRNR